VETYRVSVLEDDLVLSQLTKSILPYIGRPGWPYPWHWTTSICQDLLIHTRESLSDIAEQAGFADQAAFTRTFHLIVGMSPGRWRRDHQRR
jgi:AraC family transcriptional regulator